MTRTYECRGCDPGCRLQTDEDGEIFMPTGCPWRGLNPPKWTEVRV